MKNLVIDMGSSAFKAVGNGKQVYVPAVVGTKTSGQQREIKVGYGALPMVIFKNAKLVWPVLKGIVEGDTEELRILIDHCVTEIFGSNVEKKDIRLVTGIPQVAFENKGKLKTILQEMGFGEVVLYQQCSGALVHAGKKTGIVVSLGHGTTEIMAFFDLEYVDGVSLKKAIDMVLDPLGANQFVKHDKVKRDYSLFSDLIPVYIDDIVNAVKKIRNGLNTQEVDEMPLILTGGGTLVPQILEAFKTKIGQSILTPASEEDAVFGIANGMLKMAESIESVDETTDEIVSNSSEPEQA